MLKSLHIENIAVIEESDIEFVSGYNCLTGETGAGKSIIIDAINAVLGERTSKEIIRTGSTKAFVSALFADLSEESLRLLTDSGYEVDSNGEVLVSRAITNDSSVVKINGKPATLGVLKEIAKFLVNIHGQHDNQTLLSPENHVKYIDKLAENENLLEDYYKEFRNLNSLRKELASLETDEGEKIRRTQSLEYEINEIESANLKSGESAELKSQLKTAENFEKISYLLNSAYSSLNGTDETDGAVSLIKSAKDDIAAVDNEKLIGTKDTFAEVLANLENIAFDIKSVIQENEYSKDDIENIRSRLDIIRRVVLKYGGTEESALEYLQKAKRELCDISLSDERIKELSALLDVSTEKLVNLGKALTDSRTAAAKRFSKDVTEKLSYLNMEDARFEVSITQGRYTKIGCDLVEFMIMTNAGDNFKPLVKIASGGELSRIMLAIKSVLANKDDVDTLIFDEIDSGISGKAANKVGILLKSVADTRQVICVTHLAQIASYAENHLLIEKTVKDGKTFTNVKSLSGDNRINEIARIMSGSVMTDNLYKSAKELLDRSR